MAFKFLFLPVWYAPLRRVSLLITIKNWQYKTASFAEAHLILTVSVVYEVSVSLSFISQATSRTLSFLIHLLLQGKQRKFRIIFMSCLGKYVKKF